MKPLTREDLEAEAHLDDDEGGPGLAEEAMLNTGRVLALLDERDALRQQLSGNAGELEELRRKLEAAERERDLLLQNPANKLDGYRELGAKCARLEEERAAAQADAAMLREALVQLVHVAGCSNGCPPDDMTCATNRANAALAATSDAWLEDLKSRVRREALEVVVDLVKKTPMWIDAPERSFALRLIDAVRALAGEGKTT